jgi:myo-inositol catabolism protein IolC
MTEASAEPIGPPSPAQPLFILAMDHRDSFTRTLFGAPRDLTVELHASVLDAKALIFEAAQRLVGTDLGGGHLGVLVDERYGADVARQVKAAGFTLAMPVEASGHDSLTLEYGDDFPSHIEAFDPDWVKVLVRFNPGERVALREAQTATLRRLSDWCAANRRHLLLELLVPPTREDLVRHDDQALFDEHERPELTVRVIHMLTRAGVHPRIWELEGYETTAGAQLVLDAVSALDPASSCIVLGRNAPQRQVDHWLDVAAPLQGFVGFAIGPSIWDEPLADYLAGRADRDATQSRIADRYGYFIRRYLQADVTPRGVDDVRREPFTYSHPRPTPDREAAIRKAAASAAPEGSNLPAWMVQSLLAEVDALRAEEAD